MGLLKRRTDRFFASARESAEQMLPMAPLGGGIVVDLTPGEPMGWLAFTDTFAVLVYAGSAAGRYIELPLRDTVRTSESTDSICLWFQGGGDERAIELKNARDPALTLLLGETARQASERMDAVKEAALRLAAVWNRPVVDWESCPVTGEHIAERVDHGISVVTANGQRYYTDFGYGPVTLDGMVGTWGKLTHTQSYRTTGLISEQVAPRARSWRLDSPSVDPEFGLMTADRPRPAIDRDLESLGLLQSSGP